MTGSYVYDWISYDLLLAIGNLNHEMQLQERSYGIGID